MTQVCVEPLFVVGSAGELPFTAIACIIFLSMDYDVAIIGGAFSGAATALVLKRRSANARILIIEKTTEFDRKVGESTTEVSSCYMTRILGLTHHLGHHHLPKQGLRLWFSQHPEQSLDDCVELGARYGARKFYTIIKRLLRMLRKPQAQSLFRQ